MDSGADATCNRGPCLGTSDGIPPDTIPFGWCTTVDEEHSRVEGHWVCRSTTDRTDAGGLTLSLSDSDLGSIFRTSVELGDTCIEGISYTARLDMDSELFSVSVPCLVEILHEADGDRTIAYDGFVSARDVRGSLFEGVEEDPDLEVFSRDPIGSYRRGWTVNLGLHGDDFQTFVCE